MTPPKNEKGQFTCEHEDCTELAEFFQITAERETARGLCKSHLMIEIVDRPKDVV